MVEQPQVQPIDPDLSLIRGMIAGDMRALDELYARHGRAILGFLMTQLDNRQLAEEVLQDVMLAAWNNAPNFRGESKVRTWLLVIARNRAINARRRRRPTLVELDETYGIASDETGPMEYAERQFKKETVQQALDSLSDEHREILTLAFYQQLSGPEIAEVLGIAEGTVKSRLHRAKSQLKRVLRQEGSF